MTETVKQVEFCNTGLSIKRSAAIRRELDALCMVEIKAEHMTGKDAIEPAGKNYNRKEERPPGTEGALYIPLSDSISQPCYRIGDPVLKLNFGLVSCILNQLAAVKDAFRV